jgi:hypothetical protein
VYLSNVDIKAAIVKGTLMVDHALQSHILHEPINLADSASDWKSDQKEDPWCKAKNQSGGIQQQ